MLTSTMKHQDILKQYVAMRKSLENERANIQARLNEIDAALGLPEPVPTAVSSGVTPPARVRANKGPGRPKGSKGKLSAAGRAALVAAQKARWAKFRAARKNATPAAALATAAPGPAPRRKG